MDALRQELKSRYFSLVADPATIREFEAWVYQMPQLEGLFASQDYLALLELDYSSASAVDEVSILVNRVFGPVLESEWETLLLQRKLENALRAPFLWMVEEIEDLIGFRRYPLTELGITDYGSAAISNFLDMYSPNQRTLVPQVDEKVYEEYFSGLRKSVERLVKWLDDGTIIIHKEIDRLGEPRYSFDDHRTEENRVLTNHER